MKLTVFAATGRVGRHILEQALAAGHDVTAVVRDPGRLPATRARVVVADLADATSASLLPAVQGADAVLSALGPPRNSEAGTTWVGTRAIVQAMRTAGVRRLVAVSAAPVATMPGPGLPAAAPDPGDGVILGRVMYPLLKLFLRRTYTDLARMENVLRGSGLDWTSVRPVQLTDKPMTGSYRTEVGRNVPRGRYISRADVAHCMLRALERPETIRQAVGIAD
ncbi:NAD(P)-dependent oxidoreductase [Nonomuraea sediminis]|uniref:NAD(P)-dependent oxidoreductase n=1 Tax=Nonomuraea sediminis TaxID=2835864 RepID=UPI001BDD0637|nr:SDR family oxidoreductase [Nonomuraea sediminis]